MGDPGGALQLQVMESQNDAELTQIELTPRDRSDSGSSLSTIYDPAAITLDPKYTPRAADCPADLSTGQSEQLRSMIISSPKSPRPGINPFDFHDLDGDPEKVFDGYCGLSPFRTLVFVLHCIIFVAAFVLVIVGALQIRKEAFPDLTGISTQGSLILSGTTGFNIFCLITGVLLVGQAFLGIYLLGEISYGDVPTSKKCMYFLYQTLLLIFVLIFAAMSAMTCFVVFRTQGQDVYEQVHWLSSVQEKPADLCKVEEHFGCAGYELAQCSYFYNDTAYRYCPGQFCLNICQVDGENEPSNSSLCAPCMYETQHNVDFGECAKRELVQTGLHACSTRLNDSLRTFYKRSFALALGTTLSIVLLVLIIAFRSCRS